MSTVESEPGGIGVSTQRRLSPGRIIVWVVAAVVFAYVTAQAVGNLTGVSTLISSYNHFVKGTALTRQVPWPALILNVATAPVAFVVAWIVSRKMTLVRMIVVFALALCVVSALWFTLSQIVAPSVTIGS